MLTIQELYRNLEEHKLELKRYKRNKDENQKKSLALKALNLLDDKDVAFDEFEPIYKEEIALLRNKL